MTALARHTGAATLADTSDGPTALVAGGGIAGIAAALRLAEAGVRVTLLETRPRLGGRATSFTDPRTGETLDNCQHVVMGCCTAFLDLLARLGVLDRFEWTRQQHWFEPGGRESIIRPSALPAPLHFAPSILGVRFLSGRERLLLGWGAHRVAVADRSRWRGRTFADFLADARQSPRLVARFWEPVIVSACNLPVARVCAAAALHVFQDGFFGNPRAAEIGLARVPLLHLYDRAESVIASTGGRVRLGFSVTRLDGASITGTSAGTPETLHADAVVCALPVERMLEVVDPLPRERDPRLRAAAAFPWSFSPILGVHLAFDRPVLTHPHAVFVGGSAGVTGGVQWLFRKDDAGRRVHAVISAADEWMALPEERIAQRVVADLHAHLPGSRGAVLQSVRAVKEKRATFAPVPGIDAARPAAAPPEGAPDLGPPIFLAGDYTATGWPATMEGAARSGYAAAAAMLARLAAAKAWRPRAEIEPVADLPRTGLARYFVRRGPPVTAPATSARA